MFFKTEVPDKLKPDTDLVDFCHKNKVELRVRNQGRIIEARTGKEVKSTYLSLREFTISAFSGTEKDKTHVSFHGEIEYDTDVVYRDGYSTIKYLFRNGDFILNGIPYASMGGCGLRHRRNDNLSKQMIEVGKPAIVALETILGRTLIKR
jgi:hypothetical protein